jgi:hypothetical protein
MERKTNKIKKNKIMREREEKKKKKKEKEVCVCVCMSCVFCGCVKSK